MSVTRYRGVDQMPPPDRGEPTAPGTYRRIRELWRFSSRLLPPLFAPGVSRYRTIEESQQARETATIERMRAMRARRVGGPSFKP